MRLNLCNSLESRDGTLVADAKLKNAVVENIEGSLVVVKRPGITLKTELAPGLAQGLFSLNGLIYAIVNDTFYFGDGGGGGSPIPPPSVDLEVVFDPDPDLGGSWTPAGTYNFFGALYRMSDGKVGTPVPVASLSTLPYGVGAMRVTWPAPPTGYRVKLYAEKGGHVIAFTRYSTLAGTSLFLAFSVNEMDSDYFDEDVPAFPDPNLAPSSSSSISL